MYTAAVKRLKRVFRMRFRKNFALTQCLLVIIILYLAKRSRDRHKMADESSNHEVILPGYIDPDGGTGLFHENMDADPGGTGPMKDLIDSVNNKRMDVFDAGEVFPDSPPVETGVAPPQSVGVPADAAHPPIGVTQPPDGVLPQGIAFQPNSNQNIPNQPLASDSQLAAADAGEAYQIPVPGNDMALDVLDEAPDQTLGSLEGAVPQPPLAQVAPPAQAWDPAQQQVVPPGQAWDPAQQQVVAPAQAWDPAQQQVAPPAQAWDPAQQQVVPPAQAWDPAQQQVVPPAQAWDPAQQPVAPPAQVLDPAQQPVAPPAEVWDPAQQPVAPPAQVWDSAEQQQPQIYKAPDAGYDANGLEVIPQPDVFPYINPARFSLEVTEEMINNFQVKLPPLLENYKNPCWIEEVPEGFTYDDSFFNTCHYVLHTNKLKHGAQYKAFENVLLNRTAAGERTRVRCFPYFFLIGVGKCATTDVFDTLKKYFMEMAPIFLKEPHYWEWKRCIDKMICRGAHRTPTFAEYLDSFDSSSDFLRERKVIRADGSEYHDMLIGDFTPSTLAFHPCWRLLPGNEQLDEPRYINAHYIRAIRPETKFIAVMRDPVERIFSNFRMRDRMSAEEKHNDAEDFHREMVGIIEYLNACMETKSARACAYTLMRFDYGTHVTNSMYEIFISDWFKIFPRDQFLFIRMEDYMVGRVPNFQNIVNFLGLAPMSPENEMMIGSKSVVNQAPPAAMFNETRTLLQDFFRPFNRRLADLLGDEGWTWGY